MEKVTFSVLKKIIREPWKSDRLPRTMSLAAPKLSFRGKVAFEAWLLCSFNTLYCCYMSYIDDYGVVLQ